MTDNTDEISMVRIHAASTDGQSSSDQMEKDEEKDADIRRRSEDLSAEEALIISETKRQMSNLGPILQPRPEDIPHSYLSSASEEIPLKYLKFPPPKIDYSEVYDAPERYREIFYPPNSEDHAKELVGKILSMSDEERKDFINHITPSLFPLIIGLNDYMSFAEKPSTIAWRNLYYRKDGEMRLQGLSGFLRSGMLLCVLGAPDAGVTTLFEVLNGRTKGGKTSGELLLNGRPPDESWDKIVGFCEKEDIHLPMLTVKETLYFSARLRTPRQMSDCAIMTKVEIYMKLLGLSHVAESRVGDALLRGISGGERRRLSYGCELVAGHSIIIGDLITNGLDSASAYTLIATAKRAAQAGRSLMCSLVQPSPDLLALFDAILLMSKGSQLYFGPPSHALPYLNSIGFIKPDKKSIPDFLEELSGHPERFYKAPIPATIPFVSLEGEKRLLKLKKQKLTHKASLDVENKLSAVAVGNASWQKDDTLPVHHHNDEHSDESDYDFTDISHRSKVWLHARNSYKQSIFNHELGIIHWNLLETIPTFIREDGMNKTPVLGKAIHKTKQFISQYNAPFSLQMTMCLIRQYLMTARDKTVIVSAVVRAVIIGLIIGSLFYNIGTEQADVRTRFGLFYYMLTFTATSQLAFVPTMMRNRAIYYLQTQSNYFHGSTYFIAFTLLGIPIAAIESFAFVLIVYGLTGLQGGVGGEQFWYLYLVIWLINLIARAWINLICNAVPNQTIATALVPVTLLIFGLFSGYLNVRSTIPTGWQWMYYLSMYTYPLRGLSQNELLEMTFYAQPGQAYTIKNGHDALALYDMDTNDHNEKWMMVRNLVFFWIAFNILASAAMLYIDFSPRGLSASPQWADQHSQSKSSDSSDQQQTERRSSGDIIVPVKQPSTKELAEALRPRSVCLEWKGLDYIVDIGKGQKRTLLKQVYGYAEPGKMTALMGASGAGKSTLLDVLSGMKTGGEIKGDILVNGLPKDAKSWSSIAGYVEQSDSHNPTSTVREAILFSARLRLSKDMTDQEKQQKVDQIIEILELIPFKNSQIGSPDQGGLSPDVRKKVTIAVEMVTQPSILFLDEPSTGLESSGALSVIKTVRRLCQEMGISVLCTIHQPSAEIVELFDNILLLKKGGEVALFSPLEKVSDYCESIGYSACPSEKNLADHVMDIIKDATAKYEEGRPDAIDLAKTFLDHPLGKQVTEALKKGVTPPDIRKHAETNPVVGAERVGFLLQTKALLSRTFISTIRNLAALRVRMNVSIIVGLLFGTLFYQMGNGQKDATNRLALLFMSILIPVFSAAFILPELFAMRPIYFRERQANMYSPFAYFIARFIADIPFQFLESFLYSVIAYWMSGLTDEDGGKYFGAFLLTYFLVRMYGIGQANTVGALVKGAEQANGLQSILANIPMIFAGFFIAKDNIPKGWKWMYHLGVFHYPLNYLASNELENLSINCEGGVTICPITKGTQILETFGINPDDRSLNIGVLCAYVAFFHCMSFIALKYINHIKR